MKDFKNLKETFQRSKENLKEYLFYKVFMYYK